MRVEITRFISIYFYSMNRCYGESIYLRMCKFFSIIDTNICRKLKLTATGRLISDFFLFTSFFGIRMIFWYRIFLLHGRYVIVNILLFIYVQYVRELTILYVLYLTCYRMFFFKFLLAASTFLVMNL